MHHVIRTLSERCVVSLVLLFSLYQSGTAHAQPAGDPLVYEAHMTKGRAALNRSDFRQAELLFEAALEAVTRLSPADGRYLAAVDALCKVYIQTVRADDCDKLRERAIAHLESSLGAADSSAKQFRIDLVAEYIGKHRYGDAERLLQNGITTCESQLGPHHPVVATYLNNLGTLYYYQGWFKKAEACLLSALAIDSAHYGPTAPLVADDLHNLAELYLQMGRSRDARPLFERAEAITSQADLANRPQDSGEITEQQVTVDHYSFPGLADYQAALEAMEERDYSNAAVLLERAIDAADQAGANEAWVEQALQQHAAMLHQLQRYPEAEPLHKRLIAMRESVGGLADPMLPTILNNLGIAYAVQGRHGDAAICYKRALSIYALDSASDLEQLAMLHSNLAGSYRAQKQYPEAERSYLSALEIRESAYGANDVDVAVTLRSLAAVYDAMRRHDDARSVLIRSTEALRTHAPAGNAELAATLLPLAQLYHRERKFQQAESCYVEVIEIIGSTSGDSRFLEPALENLATLYGQRGEYGRSQRLFERLIASVESRLGPNDPALATVLNNLAMFLYEQERFEEAEPLQRRAVGILETNYGVDDKRLAKPLANFAVILRRIGRGWEADVFEARAQALQFKR